MGNYVFVATMEKLKERNCLTVHVEGHTLVLFAYGTQVYAVDNRCPHMGFPLDKGTVKEGILTCHWHHARFDLASGGTFDQWADDVPAFPVEVRDGDVWVDVEPKFDPADHQQVRLRVGLERDLSLVISKAVILLLDRGEAVEPFRIGLDFGTLYRRAGWGQGLTILACMMNLVPYLDEVDQARALYHGLSAVASNSAGMAPRFQVHPLPNPPEDLAQVKSWLRQFVEVRDDDGAERCIVSAVRAGANDQQLADMLFSAATDHRYIQGGHTLDFINKALEALDIAGWEMARAEQVLSSLVRNLTDATRMEESNAWRSPIDLVFILEDAFQALPGALVEGAKTAASPDRDQLVDLLLGDDPQKTVTTLLRMLRSGVKPNELASIVSYTAALRIARFHTSNEFGDWDTALHTFTFANAVQKGLERVESRELVRGVFDAAMSIYLDRFLNIPPAKLPNANGHQPALDELEALLDKQQQVNQAGRMVADYIEHAGDESALLARLGHLLLREDRDFHTIQTIEAAFEQYQALKGTPEGTHVLIAAARYLAAHSPTVRSQEQTFTIAQRLYRGEKLFEG